MNTIVSRTPGHSAAGTALAYAQFGVFGVILSSLFVDFTSIFDIVVYNPGPSASRSERVRVSLPAQRRARAPAAFRSGPHCVATPESRMCASTTSAVASHAVMNGVPVPIVARLLGHADVRMTLRYAHLSDGDIADAAERIGSAMAQLMEP